MVSVIEQGFISEPELIDFIIGYKKLIKANIVSEDSFLVVMEKLGLKLGNKGEIYLDENTYYTLSV